MYEIKNKAWKRWYSVGDDFKASVHSICIDKKNKDVFMLALDDYLDDSDSDSDDDSAYMRDEEGLLLHFNYHTKEKNIYNDRARLNFSWHHPRLMYFEEKFIQHTER